MTHIVALSPSDRCLLQARFEEHGNSHMRMLQALVEAGAKDAGARLVALRRIERRYDLDLAEICVLHARRNDARTHPIERIVVDFIAEEHHGEHDTQLWVLPDRVRQIRELMDGRLVGEPEA
ncbi:MAG TPA: hypothetical protein VFZ69_01295 [Longimicrobiales bacterium]